MGKKADDFDSSMTRLMLVFEAISKRIIGLKLVELFSSKITEVFIIDPFRIGNYPYMFIKDNGLIDINKRNEILWLEAFVGGYFGTSFEVKINLENRKATYRKIERAYEIEVKELGLEDAVVEKFQLDMDSIRIVNWDKEYYTEALDGTSWSLEIKTLEGSFQKDGSNAFPKNWSRFCSCIEKAVGGEFR